MRKGRWSRRGMEKKSLSARNTHSSIYGWVGGLRFPKRFGVFRKHGGKRDIIRKLGNRAQVFVDKEMGLQISGQGTILCSIWK